MSYRNNKGFSLIELMVVLTIVGIMLALMVPNVGGFISNQEINEAAQNVAGALRTAKELAVSKNVRTVVEIDDNTRTYVIYRQPMQNETLFGAASTFYGDNNYFVVDTRPISPKGQIGMQTKATSSPSGGLLANTYLAIGFTPRGTAVVGNVTDAGTIYLMSDKDFAKDKKTGMRAISVSTTTGRARIYQWGGSSWQ